MGVRELLRATGRLVRRARLTECQCRSDGNDLALVSLDQLPVAFVHQEVMAMAQKDLILDFTASAVEPVEEVVAVAP